MELVLGWAALGISILGLFLGIVVFIWTWNLDRRLQELHDEERARVNLFITDLIDRGRS
jgi:hypothetical protein